jgi:hypothetical protein
MRCKDGRSESKGQRKDGVLPLDHLQGDAGFGKYAGHGARNSLLEKNLDGLMGESF